MRVEREYGVRESLQSIDQLKEGEAMISTYICHLYEIG